MAKQNTELERAEERKTLPQKAEESSNALTKRLEALEALFKEGSVLSRWSFDQRLDGIAAELATFVRYQLLASKATSATHDLTVGCSLLYRTQPENCYVGGASSERREMEFDARHYALPEDWLDSITAFSMSTNVAFVLDNCVEDWWPMTQLGLEHHKKDCETPSDNTQSFLCYPILEDEKIAPIPVRHSEEFEEKLSALGLVEILQEDRALRIKLRRENEPLTDLLSPPDSLKGESEVLELLSSNQRLHEDARRSGYPQIDWDDDIQKQLKHLGEGITGVESYYYLFNPENRLADLGHISIQEKIDSNKYPNLKDILGKNKEDFASIISADALLQGSLATAAGSSFIQFKADDMKQKKRVLRLSRAAKRNSQDYNVAALRVTTNLAGNSTAVLDILESHGFLPRISEVLREGRKKIGGDEPTHVALGTLGEFVSEMPELDKGEYYTFDRLVFILQAMFGGCEVSFFESHDAKNTHDHIQLWMVATTALNQNPGSQHQKFRDAFRSEDEESLSDHSPLYYEFEVSAPAERKPKTVRAALRTEEVQYVHSDTGGHWHGRGEIPTGDTRSFLAFGIPSEMQDRPYGVIRIVSGKKEQFYELHLFLANVVAKSMRLMWKLYPKNEALEPDTGRIGAEMIERFLGGNTPWKVNRFRRELRWLLQKSFNDFQRVQVHKAETEEGSMVLEVAGFRAEGDLETAAVSHEFHLAAKKQGEKYEPLPKTGLIGDLPASFRETRTLQGAIVRRSDATGIADALIS